MTPWPDRDDTAAIALMGIIALLNLALCVFAGWYLLRHAAGSIGGLF